MFPLCIYKYCEGMFWLVIKKVSPQVCHFIGFFEFLMNIDKYIKYFVENYGTLTYLMLFIIIFCETGLLIFFFLPGDSLLLAAGAISAIGGLNIFVLVFTLIIAAILGDLVNYHIGEKFGNKIIKKGIIKQENLTKTYDFMEKYGGKTIVYARFIAVVRTLVPFISGVSKMNYKYFFKFNILGGSLWVISFLLLGYFFGNILSLVHDSELVLLAITFIFLFLLLYKKIRMKSK